MKYTLKCLKKLLSDNGIETGAVDKIGLSFIAYENGLLTREDLIQPMPSAKSPAEKRKVGRPRKYPKKEIDPNKVKDPNKGIDPKYERLRTIRNNPRKVILTDVVTGETKMYGSLYKAYATTGHECNYFCKNSGKIVDGIKIEVF